MEDRHREILNVEKSIQELRNLFREIAFFVADQGDKITNLNQYVLKSQKKVESAKRDVEAARRKKNTSRRVKNSMHFLNHFHISNYKNKNIFFLEKTPCRISLHCHYYYPTNYISDILILKSI